MLGSQNKEKTEAWTERLNRALTPPELMPYTALDLFAGCGGLSLGFEAIGFKTIGIEMKKDCCDTYNKNLKGKCIQDFLTPEYDFPSADIVIGGPPCQPFSVGGNQLGIKDSRDGFPVFLAAIKKIRPKIWLFENVRGLMYKNEWYLNQIIQEMESLGYIVEPKLFDVSDHQVPQNRHRLVVVGHKGGFTFPEKRRPKISSGDAIRDLAQTAPVESRFITSSMDKYIANYERASKCINPRDLDLNKPARTLTCRNLAAATGDMMRIKLKDGRRRMLLVREAARLQSFPDWFEFCGTQTDVFNQIGNAVPPYFAYQLALKVHEYMECPLEQPSVIRAVRKRPSRQMQMIAYD